MCIGQLKMFEEEFFSLISLDTSSTEHISLLFDGSSKWRLSLQETRLDSAINIFNCHSRLEQCILFFYRILSYWSVYLFLRERAKY